MPTQTSRPGESLHGGVWGRVDVRWDSLLAWDEKCSDRASAGCALISVCVWIGWLELCWSHAFHSKLMNLWYWTSESSDLPLWKQACWGNQFWVSFSAAALVCARLCVCGLAHLIVYSDAKQTLASMCVSLCTCVGVLLNSKGYSYHKKKGDLMSKHLPCLSFPLNVSLLCSIFTVTSCLLLEVWWGKMFSTNQAWTLKIYCFTSLFLICTSWM